MRNNTGSFLGRVKLVATGVQGSAPESAVQTEYVSCACSAVGKVWRVSRPYKPDAQHWEAPEDPQESLAWTTYSYDALGRVESVELPGNTGTIRIA